MLLLIHQNCTDVFRHCEFLQRFALRAHGGYDAAAAMKFALEHQNPLVCGAVISKDGGAYPAAMYSLLSVSDPNVLLWAVKPAEEGIQKGVIVRLWNVSDAPAKATIKMEPGISAGTRTTHIETKLEALPVDAGVLNASFARQQIQTYRLELAPVPAVNKDVK